MSSFLCCFFSPESRNKLRLQPQERENASKMKRKQVTRRHISITIMVQKTMKKAIYETINHLKGMRKGSIKVLMADDTFGFNASLA